MASDLHRGEAGRMSQTKAVHVFDRLAWFWDNSHDVVLAYVVEAAQEDESIDAALLSDWRVWASIQDLALTYPRAHDVEATLMLQLLESARSRVLAGGDLHPADLADWSVLAEERVSGGFLRTAVLPVKAMLDAVDGLTDLVARTLEPEPPGTTWCIGTPGGRTTIQKRRPTSDSS